MKQSLGIACLMLTCQALATTYDDSRVQKAQQDLGHLSQAVQRIAQDLGRVPNNEEWPAILFESTDAGARWQGPYLPMTHPKPDPWNRRYLYLTRAQQVPAFGIYSSGANGIDERGAGDDITTWQGYDRFRYWNPKPTVRLVVLATVLAAMFAAIRYFRRARRAARR